MAVWLLGEDLLLFKVLYKSVCEAHNIIIQGQACNRIVYICNNNIYEKKYSILIGLEQCSSSETPVQITHCNSGLWLADRQ